MLGRKTSLNIFREVRKREDNVQHTSILVLMRDEKNGRKKQARSNKQQQGKAIQHTQAITFLKKNELPHVHYNVHTHVYTPVYNSETYAHDVMNKSA